jgi:hypothetical protein
MADELFVRLRSTVEPNERKELAEQVTIELMQHWVAEEQWLYPTIRERGPGGAELADRETAEHSVSRISSRIWKSMIRTAPDSLIN